MRLLGSVKILKVLMSIRILVTYDGYRRQRGSRGSSFPLACTTLLRATTSTSQKCFRLTIIVFSLHECLYKNCSLFKTKVILGVNRYCIVPYVYQRSSLFILESFIIFNFHIDYPYESCDLLLAPSRVNDDAMGSAFTSMPTSRCNPDSSLSFLCCACSRVPRPILRFPSQIRKKLLLSTRRGLVYRICSASEGLPIHSIIRHLP